MKGRPITGEELWKLLKATRKVVGPKAAKHYRRLLVGLWWSGLRIGEAVALRWDGISAGLVVDMTGRRPMLRIDAAAEKGNRNRLLPLAPEFCRLLSRVPADKRRGRVFSVPHPKTGRHVAVRRGFRRSFAKSARRPGSRSVPRSRARSTRRPGERRPVEVVKFASAHDLRRSFGERWAERVLPKVLMELMRHESIGTTMRFYVGQNAQRTADAAWAAYEAAQARQQAGGKPPAVNTSVNTWAETPKDTGEMASDSMNLPAVVRRINSQYRIAHTEPRASSRLSAPWVFPSCNRPSAWPPKFIVCVKPEG